MAITAEERTARSLRMKEMWQKKKAQNGEPPADPAVREAMAKVPMNSPVGFHSGTTIPFDQPLSPGVIVEKSFIAVEVDWERIPVSEGQSFYAQLKAEFEKAGRILNARSMQRTSGYTCFMCGEHFEGQPKYTDHSYTDPKTGLVPTVYCCGEHCVILFNAKVIGERHARELARAEQERNG